MNITYRIKRSKKRKKTISLQIRNASEVLVSAPYFTPREEIDRFIDEKQHWIHNTIRKHEADSIQNREKKFENGETFLYLGQSYPLEVFFEPFENAGVVFRHDRFYLNASDDPSLRRHYLVSWYKRKAIEYISQRVDFYEKVLKLHHKNIRITSAKSQWGSCSEDDRLAFSFRLIMAPPEVIDYVVIHELTHIREKNHSAGFWHQVEAALPEYRKHRQWLKDHQHLLNL